MTELEKFFAKFEGAFDRTSEKERERIMFLLAHFHFRDGKKYDDGSMGTVNISPKQFRDLLAFERDAAGDQEESK